MKPRGRLRAYALLAAAAILVAAAVLLPPLRQPQSYHAFADQRTFAGVPNAWNVLSNVPFFIVGALGLWALRRLSPAACGSATERRAIGVVFASLIAVGFGSSYYHLAPDDARLFWDRLPLAVLLCGLLGVVALERAGLAAGRRLFAPLLALGAGSVLVWRLTADLRLYVLVQGVAMGALPVLLLIRPPRYDRGGDLGALAALYALAKGAEALDARIYTALSFMSGHTLKHLLAAAAMAVFLRHVTHRRLKPGAPERL